MSETYIRDGLDLKCAMCDAKTRLKRLNHAEGCATSKLCNLTPMERLVAERVASGMTDPDIGADLGMQEATAGRHRFNLYQKLKIHSAVQLTALVVEERVRKEYEGQSERSNITH